MNKNNLRVATYTEEGEKKQGWVLLVTGGLYSPPLCIIERQDGTIAQLELEKADLKFIDRAKEENQ